MSRFTLILAGASLALLTAAPVFAEDPAPAPTAQTGPNFVDQDGDGICDRAGTGNQGAGKGMGKGRQGKGQGKGFVDANKDGICDKYADRKAGQGKGQGAGKGQCRRGNR